MKKKGVFFLEEVFGAFPAYVHFKRKEWTETD